VGFTPFFVRGSLDEIWWNLFPGSGISLLVVVPEKLFVAELVVDEEGGARGLAHVQKKV
jgi:hypothetical protein